MNVAAAPAVLPLQLSASSTARPWGRRLAEVAALVAAYVGLGYALHLDANAYLVLGVPFALVFQRFVARAPLREAWARGGEPVRVTRRLVLRALVFAIAPLLSIADAVVTKSVGVGLWVAFAVVGAVGAAYARSAVEPGQLGKTLRAGLLAALPAVLLFLGYAFLLNPETTHTKLPSWGFAGFIGVLSFAQYVPVCFAMEEVLFRGVLDAHAARPTDSPKRRAITAVVLSALWGLWHLPVAPAGASLASTVGLLVVSHTIAGLAITAAWRSKGNLLAPAVAHAFADGVRNALL